MADYTQLMNLEKKPKGQTLPSSTLSPDQAEEPNEMREQPHTSIFPPPVSQEQKHAQEPHQSIRQSTKQSISKPTDRITSQSTNQSSKRLTKQSISQPDNKIVEKPKAFYITQRLDKKLDEAVRYCQEVHGIKKADRSTIVNAILDNEANWTEEALDLLVDRVIGLLTSRLIS